MTTRPIDPVLLAKLLESQAGPLCAFAERWSPWPEDCVQEAFVALAAQIPPPDNPTAWLFLVTKRKAMNQSRETNRRKAREVLSSDFRSQNQSSPEQILEEKDESEKLVSLVKNLPEPMREIVILRTWGKLSWAEVQLQTQIPSTSAQRHYKMALSRLKVQMESSCPKKTN